METQTLTQGTLCHHITNNKIIYVFDSFKDHGETVANLYRLDTAGNHIHAQFKVFELFLVDARTCEYSQFTGEIQIATA